MNEKQKKNAQVLALYSKWKKIMSIDELCAVLAGVLASSGIIVKYVMKDLENGFDISDDEKYTLLIIASNLRTLFFSDAKPETFEVKDMMDDYDNPDDRLKILVKLLHKQLFEKYDVKGENGDT